MQLSDGVSRAVKTTISRALAVVFPAVFPDDCRVCGEPLRNVSRIPVCAECLAEPTPFIAEYYCVSCHMPFVNRAPLDEFGQCMMCRQGLTGYDRVYSFGSYEGALRKLIHLYKYSGVRPLARPFGKFLARAIPHGRRFDVIVPMPLHWRKRWQRGFNQSELLAREISKRVSAPVQNVVRRSRYTVSQAGLTNAKRRENVRGVFKMKRNLRLDGKNVLLIDDVLTTGASASACAKALKRAGANSVTVLTLARTDRRPVMTLQAAATGSGA